MKYTIGVDFGTLSARAVVLSMTGEIKSSCTVEYPHAVMDETLGDVSLPPDFALQDPNDYLYALKKVISDALADANISNSDVCALCIDFTACTVLCHLADGTPMCNIDEFKSNPHAYVKLWKHHGAKQEARELERVAKDTNASWLKFYNNTVSSESFFAKALETFKNAPELYNKSERISEAGDWLSFMLTGVDTRSVSFAGFKAFWSADDGYPSKEYLDSVEDGFGDIIGTKLSDNVVFAGECVGKITKQGAQLCGLCEGTLVGTPMIDAHAPLISLGITAPGTLMMVLGTSGCYIVNDTGRREIDGICASSDNSVIPGLCTYEAALACFGDQLDWFIKKLLGNNYKDSASAHADLTKKSEALKIGESGLVALNWFNGNRCPLSDFNLSGMIMGLTLTTRPEEIYRALLEGAVFSTAIIIENYKNAGIPVDNIIATGGIAWKNPHFVGILADVLDIPISVSSSPEGAAHGCAIVASVVAGEFDTFENAAKVLSAPIAKTYYPNPENHKQYMPLYDIYKTLHNHFGVENPKIMSALKKLKQK